MKILALIALVLVSASALGQDFPVDAFGDQVGNGGKGVVCSDDRGVITQVELLDFYEAQVLYGLEASFPAGSYI
jgi:hypothetical protein